MPLGEPPGGLGASWGIPGGLEVGGLLAASWGPPGLVGCRNMDLPGFEPGTFGNAHLRNRCPNR